MIRNLAIFLGSIVLLSCAMPIQKTSELTCISQEINCYRFSYASLDEFSRTVSSYAIEFDLSSPTAALSAQLRSSLIEIYSSKDADLIISSNPGLMYSLGKFIETNQIPREWLFIAEQTFIRSWNSLAR
jgi:hypothetical protein